jgi:acyl-CoA synthetase (AMP-forming)/AMP-acid ligase II
MIDASTLMPLFHIHGLIGGILSMLTAGAAVVCTPGFDALKFFEWMQEFRPSWYTAVPTMLQRIGIADKLAPTLKSEYVAPNSPAEKTLADIWAEILGVARVGTIDNFFYWVAIPSQLPGPSSKFARYFR